MWTNDKTTPVLRFAFGTILVVLGIVGLLGSIAPKFFAPRTIGRPLAMSGETQFRVESFEQMPTAGPLMFRVAKLDVKYPSAMRENETLPIEVAYSVSVNSTNPPDSRGAVFDTPPTYPLTKLDRPLKLELSSSGFTIDPKNEVVRPNQAQLPIKQLWTATPLGEGSRFILLRIDDGMDTKVRRSVSASINGNPTTHDPGGYYQLPVTVSTYFGVSRVTSSLVAFVFTLIGAILAYPIVVAFMKRRLGLQGKD